MKITILLIIVILTQTPSLTSQVTSQRVSLINRANKECVKIIGKKARVTMYTWTGNRMANGEWPEPGYVAVSDRSIKLGSQIYIGRKLFIVGDYTSKKVHKKSLKKGFDLTVDIYTDMGRDFALEFGVESHQIALKNKL